MENLLQYDESTLLEDIAFPLRVQGNYLFDYADNMIADNLNEEITELVEGEYIDIEQVGDNYKLDGDDIINDKTGLRVLRIRGWGRLQYKDKARFRQKNIVKYLTDRLNAE